MSGVEAQGVPTGRASDLEAQAAAWVRRQHFEGWTAEDQAALDTWLAESIGHQVAYWRISAGFDCTERLTALRGPMRPKAGIQSAKESLVVHIPHHGQLRDCLRHCCVVADSSLAEAETLYDICSVATKSCISRTVRKLS